MEAEFYAGNYQAIVGSCVDAGPSEPAAQDLPFAVGALAFVGRLEEARALLASQLRGRSLPLDPERIVAARFFLGVAYCRAGRTEDARREFLLNAGQRHSSSLARFYVFQGLGCYRYFTGLLVKSADLALRALQHAFAAAFPYGRLLATDLRGHALVQLGQIQNGLSVLETARALARSLALSGNAAALDCAIAVYRARFGAVPIREAIAALAALVGKPALDDSYSERSVRLELAVQTALAGEGDAAWGLLERLGTERVPDGGDARARIRFLLACANVVRLRHGPASMQPFVSEARAVLAGTRDIALELDVACLELIATTDPDARSRIRAELQRLAQRSGIERAWLRAAAGEPAFESSPPGAEVLEQDRLGDLYWACRRASPELASRLIEAGHLGLLPTALGLTPGQRLLILGRRLVVENRGNVSLAGEPPEGSLRLLAALAGAARRTKEELLELVWGISAYRPAAHDAVVHTAVSRLRAQLGPSGRWVESAAGGYRLASGVEVVSLFEAAPRASAPTEPALPNAHAPRGGVLRTARPSGTYPTDALLGLLAQAGGISSRELAVHLGVSEMTALRRLREHVEQGTITRDGKGKNTRYRLLRSVS
jgi:hypothetical protein